MRALWLHNGLYPFFWDVFSLWRSFCSINSSDGCAQSGCKPPPHHHRSYHHPVGPRYWVICSPHSRTITLRLCWSTPVYSDARYLRDIQQRPSISWERHALRVLWSLWGQTEGTSHRSMSNPKLLHSFKWPFALLAMLLHSFIQKKKKHL